MVIERGGIKNDAGHWVKGEGGHKRGYALLEELKTGNIESLPGLLEFSANKHGDAPCMGTRKIIKRERVTENNKKIEKLELGEYSYINYKDVQSMVIDFGNGINSLGIKNDKLVAMFAETRAEWFVSAMGCLRRNIPVVTLYTTLPDESLAVSIQETEVSTVITSYDYLPRLVGVISKCPSVSQVIVIEDQLEGIGSTDTDGIKIIPFKEIIAKGKESEDVAITMPTAHDLAIIMYTSGSTNRPKGVQLTHDSIMCAIKGYLVQADLKLGDRYLSYLPLAHILELSTELALLAMNVTIAYSSPLTLGNNSPKIMKGTLGDARVAQPTCMTAVPLILERIIKGVYNAVESQGFLKSKIFGSALRYKQTQDSTSFASKVLDTIIFNRVKEELGGQLKMLVVGGAPLSPETHNKFRAIFGCTLQVGYGATETAASITSMDSDDPRTGHCGPPNLGVLIKLVDWEEGGYLSTDKPRARGEIVVGGPAIAKGYYKLPEETAESFIEEDGVRWFKTGDIGEFDETGVIRIIDRMKDLVKLQNGEYVALGNIEARLKTHSLIESFCAVATNGASNVVAIMVPVVDRLKKVGLNAGFLEDTNMCDLCCDEKIKQCVLDELVAHGKKQGLGRWDLPVAIHLTTEQWTPDSGLVTAALKIRRKAIRDFFSKEIEDMYNKLVK